jgi:hypothetical protein
MVKPRWHSFYATNIDTQVIHNQALFKMRDYRDPSSTVVHHHKSAVPCKDQDHTVYDHRDASVTDHVRVDDAFAMWGIADPFKKV